MQLLAVVAVGTLVTLPRHAALTEESAVGALPLPRYAGALTEESVADEESAVGVSLQRASPTEESVLPERPAVVANGTARAVVAASASRVEDSQHASLHVAVDADGKVASVANASVANASVTDSSSRNAPPVVDALVEIRAVAAKSGLFTANMPVYIAGGMLTIFMLGTAWFFYAAYRRGELQSALLDSPTPGAPGRRAFSRGTTRAPSMRERLEQDQASPALRPRSEEASSPAQTQAGLDDAQLALPRADDYAGISPRSLASRRDNAAAPSSSQGELRVDPADGQAYTLAEFTEEYGGSLDAPPEQWNLAVRRVPK